MVSATAPLNHACGFEKEVNIVNSVCGLTQSQVDRQVIGGRGGEQRQPWSNHENQCKWRQEQPWEVHEHGEGCT